MKNSVSGNEKIKDQIVRYLMKMGQSDPFDLRNEVAAEVAPEELQAILQKWSKLA